MRPIIPWLKLWRTLFHNEPAPNRAAKLHLFGLEERDTPSAPIPFAASPPDWPVVALVSVAAPVAPGHTFDVAPVSPSVVQFDLIFVGVPKSAGQATDTSAPIMPWRERFMNAVISAYDEHDLRQLLDFRMGVRYDTIVPAGLSFRNQVYEIMSWAGQRGRMGELLVHVANERPLRLDIAALKAEAMNGLAGFDFNIPN